MSRNLTELYILIKNKHSFIDPYSWCPCVCVCVCVWVNTNHIHIYSWTTYNRVHDCDSCRACSKGVALYIVIVGLLKVIMKSFIIFSVTSTDSAVEHCKEDLHEKYHRPWDLRQRTGISPRWWILLLCMCSKYCIWILLI